MSANGVRHFVDLADIPASDLRWMIDESRAMKRCGESDARYRFPLAGKT
jgi:hypothetical protein